MPSHPMEKKKSFDLNTLLRVLALARPYKWLFIGAALLALVLAPLSVLRPYLINVMVDDYIFAFDVDGMTRMAIILIAILFGEAILRYIFIYSTNLLGQSVIRDLRTKVFDHILRLKLAFFDKTPIGTFTTRTVSDIETINQVFSQGVITIVADLLGLIAVFAIMMWSNWKLTLITLITFPILIIGSYIFKEKVKKSFQTVRTQISRMNAFLQERISGMQVVQIFNAEEQEKEKFRTINREYTRANLNAILYYAIFFPFVEIISAASLGLMVWYGARGVLEGHVTPGLLIAFPIYISMLFRPIRFIADKFNTLQMGLVAGERVFKVLDTDEVIPNSGKVLPKGILGRIEFDKVNFSYEPDVPVLKNVSFDVEPGQTLAIVGSTGSGKSTIINLLNRFYDVDSGEIKVDGVSLREYDLYAFRNRIAIVLQEVFLFAGTVYENITFNDRDITLEEVIESAKLIGAHEFFERLPGGYQFQVAERGSNLSMGQRQLISFVRALVFNPDMLILDEATSSIDTETEGLIQYAIEKLIAKRTSIIIAHRLSTIQHSDKVLVLSKGVISEYGNPKELLQIEDGHFRKLYDHQFVQPVFDS